MPEHPVTPRGFAVYAELTDRYGNKVRVQKSSLATADCAWIFASHPAAKLRPEWRERLAAAGFATQVQLDELAAFLTPSPHLDVEQARQVRDALDEFIREHSEPHGLTVAASVAPEDADASGMAIDGLADKRMAITPDGDIKPASEFTAEEKWWCDGEDCDNYPVADAPHVHVAGFETRRVDLLTGKDEHHPDGKPAGGREAPGA